MPNNNAEPGRGDTSDLPPYGFEGGDMVERREIESGVVKLPKMPVDEMETLIQRDAVRKVGSSAVYYGSQIGSPPASVQMADANRQDIFNSTLATMRKIQSNLDDF